MPSLMMMIGGKTHVSVLPPGNVTHTYGGHLLRGPPKISSFGRAYTLSSWNVTGHVVILPYFFPKFARLLLGAMGNMVMQSDKVNIAFEFAISPSVSRIR